MKRSPGWPMIPEVCATIVKPSSHMDVDELILSREIEFCHRRCVDLLHMSEYCPPSSRLLLGPRRCLQGLDDAADSDTKDHEDLEAEETDPYGVEDCLFAALEVAGHVLEEDGIHVLDEEESLEHVDGVPVWSGLCGESRPGERRGTLTL
jgi:hypothetical protein